MKPVITEFNVVCSLGLDRHEFARRMLAGESGVTHLDSFVEDKNFPIACAARLPNFYHPFQESSPHLETEMQLKAVLKPLLENGDLSGIDGIVYGSASGIAKLADIKKFFNDDEIVPENLSSEYGLDLIVHWLQQKAPLEILPENSIVCVNGCITGLSAISYAAKRIERGLNKRILVIGDEARIRPEELLKYHALGALSRDQGIRASRPFSKSRDGFVKGEGAGFVIVEDLHHAKSRGATIAAHISGYGQATDAWRLTDGREDVKGIKSAMARALAVAQLQPQDIDYINAHGTSTPKNDYLETLGIKQIFGRHAYKVPISSLKSQVGHTNIACGIVEVVACLVMLAQQEIAPTINYEADPACDLDYVPHLSRKANLRHILKNSLGFGGANAAMVLTGVS